ncbi:MotA/TolQ/ExbB proton channel family protein [Ideonella azotifigens]|uniref:MotA/TolQ/ExbB proton channel family protein n=1 Tax=Ideonella azotifigens TaxID=513160 RepID=A0ABN1K4S7_9BURK|nr:MotA/TolQ/ExbB proton channel family protein [Ideonella azotifigens]MCD2344470.1 MotA/TolQ/ExbB proton channel family protein [Ideonella azotifigens]
MSISQDFLHAATINLLYAAIVILTFVIIERLVYYVYLIRRRAPIARAIAAAVAVDASSPLPDLPAGTDVLTQAMREYVDTQRKGQVSRNRIEDLSSALFLRVDGSVNRGLWILDTIVTAAPLLGLLGTILGIMDTFQALSAGGVSDPSAVSRGIGSALFATAIGIGTALYGLLGHNVLHRLGECITEDFKSFLLETTK